MPPPISSPPRYWPTRSTRSAMSCAFDGPHAAGPGGPRVGFGQCREQLQRLDRRDVLRDARDGCRDRRGRAGSRPPTAADGWRPTRRARRRRRSGKPRRTPTRRAMLDADVGVVTRSPLPRSCSSAPSTSRSGRLDPVGERGGVGRRLEQMAVDGEAVVRVVLGPGSHRLPLGQNARPYARGGRVPRSRGSRAAPVSSRPTKSSRASAGQGSERAGARVGQSLERRRDRSRSRRSAANRRGAQREQRIRAPDRRRRSRWTSPSRSDTPSSSAGSRSPTRPSGPRSDDRTRRQESSLVHAIARAAEAMPAMSASPSVEPERLGNGRPVPGARARCWPAGTPMQLDARVEQRGVGRRETHFVVFEQNRPRGLRPVQRMDVAQSAAAFLEIGFEHERDFAGLRVSRVDARRELLEPALGRAVSHCDNAARSQLHRQRRRRRRCGACSATRSRCRDRSSAIASASRWVHTLWPSFSPASQIGYQTRSDIGGHVAARIAEEHHVEIALRAELGTAVPAHGHERHPHDVGGAARVDGSASSEASHSSTSALCSEHHRAPVSVLSARSGARSSCTPDTVRDAIQE